MEAVWAAQERLGGRVTIEQVAFPQYGVLADPGTAELLDEALRNGVEVIGGIDPAGANHDPVRHLDIVFALAERHGAGIDIHLHDGGSLGTWQLELIIERARTRRRTRGSARPIGLARRVDATDRRIVLTPGAAHNVVICTRVVGSFAPRSCAHSRR